MHKNSVFFDSRNKTNGGNQKNLSWLTCSESKRDQPRSPTEQKPEQNWGLQFVCYYAGEIEWENNLSFFYT